MLVPIFAGAAIFVLLVATLLRHRSERSNDTPSPPGLPLFGHSLMILKTKDAMYHWMTGCTIAFGSKTWQFKVLGAPHFICIVDPANVKHVLADNFDNYVKGSFFRDYFFDLLGDGIFDVDGADWIWQRKTASHIFKRSQLRNFMTSVFVQHSQLCITNIHEHCRKGQAFDIQDLFYRYTLDSIALIAFGTELGCLKNGPVAFASNFDSAQRIVMERMLSPIWMIRKHTKWLFSDEWTLKNNVAELDKFAHDLIRERRKDDLEDREDLLSRFMGLKFENGKSLTDDVLRDVIMSFVIAGRDTTANALTWCIYELCRCPEIYEKIIVEVDSVCGGDLPTHDDVRSNMPYLEAVLNETLRLHPSVPKDAKLALADDVLPDGTEIKKGQAVVYLPWIMGRLESLWEDACEFKPERWLDGQPAPSAFKFIAFNAGPRMCLGKSMAMLNAKLMLASLAQHFTFSLEKDEPALYQATLTLPVKNGLRVIASPRHSVSSQRAQ